VSSPSIRFILIIEKRIRILLYTPPEYRKDTRTGAWREKDGRGDWIRTSDLLNPIQVRYQTALRPGDRRLIDIVAGDGAAVNRGAA
jgi:hypothetical protein